MSVVSRFFDYDELTGAKTTFHYDMDTGKVTLETETPVQDMLDDAAAQFNSTDERARWGEFQRIGSVPMTEYMRLRREGILRDPKALSKYLNDRDHLKFRTRPGRV